MKWFVAFIVLFLSVAVVADDAFNQSISLLEKQSKGEIGIALVSREGALLLGYRQNSHFALCSTFKLPLAALVLSRIESGKMRLEDKLYYDRNFIEDYAPAAKRYLSSGYMTVAEAVQASLQLSDNSAANLLLREVGGPKALTDYFRNLGDKTSRLDRTEPTLNRNFPGDLRDTTTPLAIATSTAKAVFGDSLKPSSVARLQRLLIGNNTGDNTIRAGLPGNWIVGDKTGSCERGGRNDLAFFVTSSGKSFILAVYLNALDLSDEQRAELIARVAGLVSAQVE